MRVNLSPANLHSRQHRGFTLLEILVASAVLALLVLVTAGIIEAVQNVSGRASAQIEQFRQARQAGETVARRLSQATLNPYWTVALDNNLQPVRFERASELRFLAAPSSARDISNGPGSALFFQSPTGFFANTSVDLEPELSQALNTWGYFIEYGSDANYRPDFLNLPARYRFRLIEMLDPSDNLEIFRHTSDSPDYNGSEWFRSPLGTDGTKRILAENVIAMVALPRLSSVDDPSGVSLAPAFEYDTTHRREERLLNPVHQLPPMVELAFVVIDEQSASRLDWGPTPPDLGINLTNLFNNPSSLEDDLRDLEEALLASGLNARVFRRTVPIVSAKWSVEQEN